MLPRECFKYTEGAAQISSESDQSFKITEIKANDGVYVYLEGAQYPLKSYPKAENIFAMNMVKAVLIESLKLFGIFLLFINKQKALNSFNRIAHKILSPHILKDRYLLPSTKALQFFIFTFLFELGFEEESCDKFSEIISHIIENDNAYRLRVADMFTEFNGVPSRKEIKRLERVLSSREVSIFLGKELINVPKLSMALKLLRYALYIPKVKRAFVRAVKVADLETMKLDEGDRYWCAIRNDYKFPIVKDPSWIYPSNMS